MADGGEGTLDALLGRARRASCARSDATDPLGRPLEARVRARRRAATVVETAAASGLGLVAPDERDAVGGVARAGTGELIAAAVAAGAQTVFPRRGRQRDDRRRRRRDRGRSRRAGGLGGARLVVLCDVRTPFEDAARVFGPQKGAGPDDVRRLDRPAGRAGAAAARAIPRGVPMTGARRRAVRGPVGGFDAELVAGRGVRARRASASMPRMRAARAVITGEGKLDQQSLVGKLVSEVATRARQTGVPCHAVVGTRELDALGARMLDLERVLEASTVAELEAAGRRAGRAASEYRRTLSRRVALMAEARAWLAISRGSGRRALEPFGLLAQELEQQVGHLKVHARPDDDPQHAQVLAVLGERVGGHQPTALAQPAEMSNTCSP